MNQRTRRLALLAAAALAGLLVVALAALPEGRPAGTGPTASAAVGPSVPEPPPAEPRAWIGADWLEIEGALVGGDDVLFRIDGMVDAGGHLIAWGRVPMPGRNQFNDMGAVFVSVDGRSWNAIAIEHGVNALNTSEISGVAAGPAGYLAFGGVCCDPGAQAIWHSADLERWTRLELGGDIEPAEFLPTAIVGSPDGWVAVGGSHDGAEGRIWISSDGADWENVLAVEGPAPMPVLADVGATAEGLIAVGTVIGPDDTHDAAVWRSVDGRDWVRVGIDDPALAGEGETVLTSVVPHAGGIYAAGIHGSTEALRVCEAPGSEMCPPWGSEYGFVSADGESWERVDPAQVAGEQPIEFRLIVAGGPGLVLMGETSEPGSPDSTLFTSTDGRSWNPVQPPLPIGDGLPMGLAVRGREVVAIAEHSGDQRWRVWLATVR